MEKQKQRSSKSHAATRSIPGNGDKFEIARHSMSITVLGAVSSKSRASVKYYFLGVGGKNKIRQMTRVQLRSQEVSSSKSNSAIMDVSPSG